MGVSVFCDENLRCKALAKWGMRGFAVDGATFELGENPGTRTLAMTRLTNHRQTIPASNTTSSLGRRESTRYSQQVNMRSSLSLAPAISLQSSLPHRAWYSRPRQSLDASLPGRRARPARFHFVPCSRRSSRRRCRVRAHWALGPRGRLDAARLNLILDPSVDDDDDIASISLL